MGLPIQAPAWRCGWHAIDAVRAQTTDPWAASLPTHFEASQWHAHTYTLPPDAVPLWRSHCFEQQGFVKGNSLAMQFHLEVTADSIQDLAKRYANDLSQLSDCVQSAEQLTEKLASRTEQLHQVVDQIYGHWLSSAGVL